MKKSFNFVESNQDPKVTTGTIIDVNANTTDLNSPLIAFAEPQTTDLNSPLIASAQPQTDYTALEIANNEIEMDSISYTDNAASNSIVEDSSKLAIAFVPAFHSTLTYDAEVSSITMGSITQSEDTEADSTPPEIDTGMYFIFIVIF